MQHLFHGNIFGKSKKGEQGEVYHFAERSASVLARIGFPLHPSGQDSSHLSRSRIPQDGRKRMETQAIQWDCIGGSKPPFGIGRSGICQVASGTDTTDLCGYGGSSGKSVKIWVRFSLSDGTLPETEEQASLFHAQAYRVAVQCFQPIIPFPITLKEPETNYR